MEKPTVTLADVAKHAHVSKMSVSRVLNDQPGVSPATRKRILEAVEQLGYIPAPGPRAHGDQAKMLALLIPNISSIYMGEILRGVSSAAERLGYGLMLYTQGAVDHTERTNFYLSRLKSSPVEGVLMVVPLDYEVIVKALELRGLPHVIIDHHNGTGEEPSVTATNRKGILDAMRHLLALGHRRIGFMTGRMDVVCSHDRLAGYRDGLAEVGLPYDAELVLQGDFTQPTGFQQGRVFLDMAHPPSAIVASNDAMAFGVMDAAKATGLAIGQDISIVGFDDIFMASQVYPALTTVRQPMANMGEAALELLTTIIEGRTPLTLRRELPTELIIRHSTGRAPSRSR